MRTSMPSAKFEYFNDYDTYIVHVHNFCNSSTAMFFKDRLITSARCL